MNRSQISKSILLLLTLSICIRCQANDTTRLKVVIQVPPGDYDSLTYHLSPESFTAYSLLDFKKEYFDSTGNANISIVTNRIGWLFLTLHPNKYDRDLKKKSRIFLLVRPGDSYRIDYDSCYSHLFRICGDYEEAQKLFNQFNHSNIATTPRTNWYSNCDSLPADLLMDLRDSISYSLKPFHELFKEERIDEEYFNTIHALIQYSHADAILDHLEFRHMLYNNPRRFKSYKDVVPINLSLQDKLNIEGEVFSLYPPNSMEARILPGLSDYIDKYLKYKARIDLKKSYDERQGQRI